MCVWRVWGIELKCAARLTLTMIWNFAVAGMNKKKYIEHRHTRHKKIEKKENMVLNDSLYRYTVHGTTSFNVLSHCIYSRMSPSHSVAVTSKRILCMCDRKNRRKKIRIPSSDIRVCPNPNTFRFCFAFWYGMTATQSLLHLNGAVNWKKRRGEKGARFTYATELFFLTACIFGLFLIHFLCTANVCVCVCRVWCNKIIICQIRMNDGK